MVCLKISGAPQFMQNQCLFMVFVPEIIAWERFIENLSPIKVTPVVSDGLLYHEAIVSDLSDELGKPKRGTIEVYIISWCSVLRVFLVNPKCHTSTSNFRVFHQSYHFLTPMAW